VNLHYAPVHLQPYYRALGFAPGLCPEAERYGQQAITLPLFAAMTDAEQDTVIDALRSVLGA
jgi:dTDP-4-amino-4,6-dideoxygalactose transaminase